LCGFDRGDKILGAIGRGRRAEYSVERLACQRERGRCREELYLVEKLTSKIYLSIE
jgi:hypothetical protein